jgi:hypothetical protein
MLKVEGMLRPVSFGRIFGEMKFFEYVQFIVELTELQFINPVELYIVTPFIIGFILLTFNFELFDEELFEKELVFKKELKTERRDDIFAAKEALKSFPAFAALRLKGKERMLAPAMDKPTVAV